MLGEPCLIPHGSRFLGGAELPARAQARAVGFPLRSGERDPSADARASYFFSFKSSCSDSTVSLAPREKLLSRTGQVPIAAV
jgi:hypothetical protein